MSTEFSIPSDIPQTRAAAQVLEDKLANANPTNLADSQAVSTALEVVGAVLTHLNQEDMLWRDGAMQAAAAEVKGPLQTLSGLKDQLTEISTRLATLAGIANDVDQFVNGCRRSLGCDRGSCGGGSDLFVFTGWPFPIEHWNLRSTYLLVRHAQAVNGCSGGPRLGHVGRLTGI